MLRVLHVISNMDVGGMESMIMNYYRCIDKTEVQFDFLILNTGTCFFEKEIHELGGKIFKVTPRRKNILLNNLEMKKFFKNHHYDIVEIHQGITYLLPLKLASKHNVKKIIIHNHGIDSKYKKGFYNIYRESYVKPYIEKHATNFIACSKKVLNDLFTDNIIKNKKYLIIKNAIILDNFIPNITKRREMRKQLNIENRKVIGHVGNFTYPKNQQFIIELAKNMPKYIFILVGDGDTRKELEKTAPNNVIFYGKTSDVSVIMQTFDIFILPSRWEGLPLAAIEAQAMEIPTILSTHISQETKLTDNVFFEQLNPDRWQQKIELILNTEVNTRKSAKDDIIRHGYSCKHEAKKLKKFLQGKNEKNKSSFIG